MWLEGFTIALSAANLLYLLAGTAIGLIVGVLPAIGPAFGVALFLPFTFGWNPVSALIFLAAIHATTTYGDSITSILIKTPGSAAAVSSCWDGYPMTQQGKGGKALGIAAIGSFVGGFIGWLLLVLIAKPVTNLAMTIGAPEYFALGVMALSLISLASKGDTLKGLLWALVGLTLSFIGDDPVIGLTERFTFGQLWLEGGIPVTVPMLGLFAITQVVSMLRDGETIATASTAKDSPLSAVWEFVKRPVTVVRSAIVGLFIGILPALGTTLATMTGYLVEQKYSPERDQFGKGSAAGLIAAEVSKGACVVGDLIPSFTLGVPGSVTAALLMIALVVHGIDPGPRFLLSGSTPYAVFAGILLTQAALLIAGMSVAKYLAKIALIPNALLAPMIVALTFLGAFVERNSLFDIGLMVAFGALGWVSERTGYPVVCLLLGLLLGPLVEVNFHRSMGVGLGSYSVFLTRPITLVLLLITLGFMLWPYLGPLFRRKAARPQETKAAAAASAEETTAAPSYTEIVLIIGTLLVFGLVLWKAQAYSRGAALFPTLVSVTGLILALYRLVWLLWVVPARATRTSAPEEPQGGLRPWKSLLQMAIYFVLVALVGFPIASVLYLAAVSWSAGFRRGLVLTGAAVGTGAFLYLLAQGLRMPLPESIMSSVLQNFLGG